MLGAYEFHVTLHPAHFLPQPQGHMHRLAPDLIFQQLCSLALHARPHGPQMLCTPTPGLLILGPSLPSVCPASPEVAAGSVLPPPAPPRSPPCASVLGAESVCTGLCGGGHLGSTGLSEGLWCPLYLLCIGTLTLHLV